MNDRLIYLAQTDTTAGFLSRDAQRINRVKRREERTPLIATFSSFSSLNCVSRVPRHFKKEVRRTSKTTYILPCGLSFRVAKEPDHRLFLDRFGYLFSSSANAHKESFNAKFASESADVIVIDHRGIFDAPPSTILKINNQKKRKER